MITTEDEERGLERLEGIAMTADGIPPLYGRQESWPESGGSLDTFTDASLSCERSLSRTLERTAAEVVPQHD